MHPQLIIQVLLLLAAANGAPIIVRRLMGSRWAWPVDGGRAAPDGRPWLGSSKTVRGVVAAIAASALVAPAIGLDWRYGLTVGACAMVGDLLSSFVKRRMGLKSSSMALGIDQVPESLLPAVAMMVPLGLSLGDVIAITALFFVGEIVLSRLFYAIGIREQPY